MNVYVNVCVCAWICVPDSHFIHPLFFTTNLLTIIRWLTRLLALAQVFLFRFSSNHQLSSRKNNQCLSLMSAILFLSITNACVDSNRISVTLRCTRTQIFRFCEKGRGRNARIRENVFGKKGESESVRLSSGRKERLTQQWWYCKLKIAIKGHFKQTQQQM